MDILINISESLQKGDSQGVKKYIQKAIDKKIPVKKILDEGLLKGMNKIGVKFKNNEIFVPEVLISARAMNEGSKILKPLLKEAKIKSSGKVCMGTVKGDLHDIGKNLVKMMMEGKGLEVIDLGVDVPPEKFVSTAIKEDCQIIACSALLTTTMDNIKDVVIKVKEAKVENKIKVMIGGAPVTQNFSDKIDADVYTPDATSAAEKAVEICNSLL